MFLQSQIIIGILVNYQYTQYPFYHFSLLIDNKLIESKVTFKK